MNLRNIKKSVPQSIEVAEETSKIHHESVQKSIERAEIGIQKSIETWEQSSKSTDESETSQNIKYITVNRNIIKVYKSQ
jgi:hypothetical protein